MGAAFGAAGYVDGQAIPQIRRGGSGNLGRDGPRGDVSGGAERRAGASDNMPAWIVGARDEAEVCCGGQEMSRTFLRQTDRQEAAVRRNAQPARAGRRGGSGKLCQRACLGLAKTKTDAAGHRTIAQCMQTDRIAALARRRIGVGTLGAVAMVLCRRSAARESKGVRKT